MTKYPDIPTFVPPHHVLIPLSGGQYIKTCQSAAVVACPDCKSKVGEACKNKWGYTAERCLGRINASNEGRVSARLSLARLAHKIANWIERPESDPYCNDFTMKYKIERLLPVLQRFVETGTIWPEDREVIETKSWATKNGVEARANCPECGKFEAWFLVGEWNKEVGLVGEIPMELDNPHPCVSCGLTGKKLVLKA